MSQMVGAKLRLEPVLCMAEWRGHHACIGNDQIEGQTDRVQLIGAGADTAQIRKVQGDQFEASAPTRRIRAGLRGGLFCFFQIACGTHHMGAMCGKGARSFNAQTSGNAGYKHAFAPQRYAGEDIVRCRACAKNLCHGETP
ncbi:hypothetical protein AA16373_2174 [Komagataeibacter swingsii DSM 16373]|nr:hypothetical protein AA16373_2174 [Komagataeibacter swingsii DSM 16373]